MSNKESVSHNDGQTEVHFMVSPDGQLHIGMWLPGSEKFYSMNKPQTQALTEWLNTFYGKEGDVQKGWHQLRIAVRSNLSLED